MSSCLFLLTDESAEEADLVFVFGDMKISVNVVSAVCCCCVVVKVNGDKVKRVKDG